VHSTTYLVVNKVEWIATRYLLVKISDLDQDPIPLDSTLGQSSNVTLPSPAQGLNTQDLEGGAYRPEPAFLPAFEINTPMIEMDPRVRVQLRMTSLLFTPTYFILCSLLRGFNQASLSISLTLYERYRQSSNKVGKES